MHNEARQNPYFSFFVSLIEREKEREALDPGDPHRHHTICIVETHETKALMPSLKIPTSDGLYIPAVVYSTNSLRMLHSNEYELGLPCPRSHVWVMSPLLTK